MSNIEGKREEVLNDFKYDLKLLWIALCRLSRDVVKLILCIRLPRWSWLALLAGVVVAVVLFFSLRSCDTEEVYEEESQIVEEATTYTFNYKPRVQRPEKKHRIKDVSVSKFFNDMNDTHLAVARKIGVNILKSRDDIGKAKRKLVEVNDYDAYVVDELTHSIPYLVPEAAALLKRIGENFQDSLVMKHLPPHKIIVSSVLRTESDVKRLGKSNVNSSKNSAHCFGTTIDITYKRFFSENGEEIDKQGVFKRVLAEVLRDLRQQGCCYIKHEKKQACFHITARKSPKE